MEIRELVSDEYGSALALSEAVFSAFEASDNRAGDVQAFRCAIRDPAYLEQLRFYGAFDRGTLVGVLATRCSGDHIALFFVDGNYHRQGVGKALFHQAAADNRSGSLTVNASCYAVDIYHHLGFTDTGEAQQVNGIFYTPMVCKLSDAACPCRRSNCPRHGDCVACREHHKKRNAHPIACARPVKSNV